jgi:hypothetical protein
VEYLKEWTNGLSVKTTVGRQEYTPLLNLPTKEQFPQPSEGELFNTFEVTARLRFAYLERYLETSFNRTTLGSDFPIAEFRYTKGIPEYWVAPTTTRRLVLIFLIGIYCTFGSVYWSVFAGKTYGTCLTCSSILLPVTRSIIIINMHST